MQVILAGVCARDAAASEKDTVVVNAFERQGCGAVQPPLARRQIPGLDRSFGMVWKLPAATGSLAREDSS